MNRTKKFLYNSVSTGIYQIIVMIVGFITPRVMLKVYGSEINGLVSSIAQFISYFNLVEAGIANAAIYALYKPLAENNYKSINGVVSAAKKFYTMSGYVFILLVGGLSIVYPVFITTNALSPIDVGLLVLVLGVSGALEFFTLSKYRVLLSADQKTFVISIASTIHMIINTLIIVLLANFKINIVLLRAIALISVFLRSIILYLYVKINYKFINYKSKPNNEALNKRWDALYLQILGSVQTGTPVILATMFTNLKMVSVYSIFNMVLQGINGVLSIFMSGLSASFGEIIAKKEENTLKKAYREFEYIYYLIITIVYSVAIITILPFVKIYTRGITDVNYEMPLIGFLFVLNGLLYNIKTPQGMLVMSAGLYKETRIQTTIQGLIVVLGGIILGYSFGLVGILIASCLSNLYRDIDLVKFIPKNVTNLKIRGTVYRIIIIFINIIITNVIFTLIKINVDNYMEWFLFAIVVGIISIVISIIFSFVFERDEMKNIIFRVKCIIRKNGDR